jgi:Glycosyl transferase family 2
MPDTLLPYAITGRADTPARAMFARRGRPRRVRARRLGGLALRVRAALPTRVVAARNDLCRLERRVAGRPSRERFQPLVSAVIPARNEQHNIAWVLERLPSVHEVILVDGQSTDDTVAVARSLRPDIIVVSDHARGKGDALRSGFNAATGHFIVMLDADGSMDPGEIPRFIEALMDGHDVVKGSRVLPGGGSDDLSRLRAAGNSALCATVNWLYRARFTDLCYGYFALRKACLPLLKLGTDGFEIETEMVVASLNSGLRITEVPSYELPRRYGESNLNAASDGTRVLTTLLRRRLSRFPGRLRNPWAERRRQPRETALAARPAALKSPHDDNRPRDIVERDGWAARPPDVPFNREPFGWDNLERSHSGIGTITPATAGAAR